MKTCIAYFGAKSISLSKAKGRKPQTLLASAEHNLRVCVNRQFSMAHIDPNRLSSNQILEGPCTPQEVVDLANDLKGNCANKDKFKRFDCCQAIEVMVSVDNDACIDQDAYFQASLAWLSRRLNLPVLSAVVHRDEGRPHLHILFSPAQGGCYVGGAPLVRPQFKSLCHDFIEKVAVPHGLQRPNAKLRPAQRRLIANQLLPLLRRLNWPLSHPQLWPVVERAVQEDPIPLMPLLTGKNTAELLTLPSDVDAGANMDEDIRAPGEFAGSQAACHEQTQASNPILCRVPANHAGKGGL